MAYTLDKIDVEDRFKHLSIREIMDDGQYHRRIIMCGDDVSGETQTIQRGTDENGDPIMKTVKEITEELWTDEVKANFETFKASQKPPE